MKHVDPMFTRPRGVADRDDEDDETADSVVHIESLFSLLVAQSVQGRFFPTILSMREQNWYSLQATQKSS